jgi:diguanylate cyclase (GGDEF)-like protein
MVWVGTFGGGLSRFDPRRERFTVFRHDPAVDGSLSGDRVTALAENPDGRLWVGTDGGGLNLCDFARPHCQTFRHRADDPASLPSDVIYGLRLDDGGGLWAGTRNGLAHLAPETPGFSTYTTRQGLPNDVVYGILPDRQGRLWLSSNNGIASLDPRTGRVRKYGPGDGLQASEFHFGAAYGSLSGELFFGGINGFNAFFPERLRSLQRGPQVVLTAVSGGRRSPDAPADQIERLDLGFRDERVEFEFSALDFAAPERNRFAYMLEGFDQGWLELAGGRRVTYTNLDPGRYTLRVRAANVGDVWSAEDLAVALEVAPAPWATSWALLGYSSALLGGLLGMVRLQQRRHERRREYTRHLEREVEERTRELAERQLALERVNHELTKASITDSLTGLPNRRFLLELMDREVGLVHRRRLNAPAGAPQSDLAFLMIDLDEFKAVNDTAGHVAGDSVLRQMQGVLNGACRSADIAIRWGGDEFLVVARDLDSGHLDVLAERIRARVAEHVFDLGDGRVARLTCSLGFASYPFHRERSDALTWEQVVSVADRALYVAKTSGRNAWVGLASTELTPALGLLGAIRNDLPELVRRRQLRLTTSLAAGQELELA